MHAVIYGICIYSFILKKIEEEIAKIKLKYRVWLLNISIFAFHNRVYIQTLLKYHASSELNYSNLVLQFFKDYLSLIYKLEIKYRKKPTLATHNSALWTVQFYAKITMKLNKMNI